MEIVLDASVIVKWYSNERETDLAIKIMENPDYSFAVPDIASLEVMNALLRHHREGRLSRADLDQALDDVRRNLPRGASSSNLIGRAVELARRVSHPLYDCVYLSLAERRDTVLVTADMEFVGRCRARLAGDLVSKRLQLLSEFVL